MVAAGNGVVNVMESITFGVLTSMWAFIPIDFYFS